MAGAYGRAAGPLQGDAPSQGYRFACVVRHEGGMRLILFAAVLMWSAPARAQTDPLHRAVDAYALYQQDVTASLDADLPDATALDLALERAARHDPARLTQGWLAYGALTAAQSPRYVRGVESRVRRAGRVAVLRQLRRDMTYARRRPPGVDEATQLILASNAADVARMTSAASRYEGAGRALDTSAWINAERGAREQRLRGTAQRAIAPELAPRLHVDARGASPLTDPTAFGGRRFWDALAQRASPTPPALPWTLQSDRAAALDRMLTLAALFIVDAASTETARVNAALDHEPTRECLALQQLQLRQCASITHDPNEDAHCLARHGYAAPAQCFSIARAP